MNELYDEIQMMSFGCPWLLSRRRDEAEIEKEKKLIIDDVLEFDASENE